MWISEIISYSKVSDSDEGKIEIHDRELQRLLHLTTADLRFADIIIKAVLGEDSDDPYLDGTGEIVMLDGCLRGLNDHGHLKTILISLRRRAV